MLHAHKLYGHECGRSNRYSFGGKRLTHIIVAHIVAHGVGGLFSSFLLTIRYYFEIPTFRLSMICRD